MIQRLLNYLFPKKCPLCPEFVASDSGFCASCWNKITFVKEPHCIICAKELDAFPTDKNMKCLECQKNKPHFDSIKAMMRFSDSTKKIIYNLKFHDQFSLSKPLANMMVSRFYDEIKNIDLIIPVPMNKLKRIYRKYNQAQLLANAISNVLEKNTRSDILVKTKGTKSQTSLNKAKRALNLKNSMKVQNQNLVQGKKILLVDDVVTTGITVNLCARLLKKEGAASVIVLSAARKMLQ